MSTKSRRKLVIEKHIIDDLYAFGDSVYDIITNGFIDEKGVQNKNISIHFLGNSIGD